MKTRVLVVTLFFVGAAPALRPAPARAQGEPAPTAQGDSRPAPAERVPRQIDSYGSLRHCDWTARLDNFAIELQNDPTAKGLVVSYNSPRRQSFAPHQLRASHYHLTEGRGLDVSRLSFVDGGTREELSEGLTELWVVPEGAEPPVAPRADDKYAPGFSGLFDSYTADLNVYQYVSEMSMPDDDIARAEFARKLKQQPDSVGYLVIRTPKGSPPGAWLRLARRDEQLVRELGVEAPPLKSLDGGASQGEDASVELWVLPVGAPPPVAEPPKVDWTLRDAVKLHTYENSYGQVGEDGERWMLANLAEFLRENPTASALLVAREEKPYEEPEGATDPDETLQSPEAQEAPAEVAAETPEESAETDEEEEKALTAVERAEAFRERLAGEHGISRDRLVVKEGRKVEAHGGRIHIWVVPEKGAWPDPSALDPDEVEAARQRQLESGGKKEADASAPAPPR